jgi:hypothetical protein
MSDTARDDVQVVRTLLANAGIVVGDEDVRVLAEKRPKLRKVVSRLRLAATRDALLAPAHTYPAPDAPSAQFIAGE